MIGIGIDVWVVEFFETKVVGLGWLRIDVWIDWDCDVVWLGGRVLIGLIEVGIDVRLSWDSKFWLDCDGVWLDSSLGC